MGKMETQDFLLLLLDAFGGKAESETRMQKLTFLAKKEYDVDLDVKFKWHNYGPFSEDLKKAFSELREKDLIRIDSEIRKTFMNDKYRITKFQLTDKGRAAAHFAEKTDSPDEVNCVNAIVKQYGHSPLSDILSYVYGAYSPGDL
jgi:uncharacterized protein YwgA